MPIVKAEVLRGVEGKALYFNEKRIAGPKPWGGGPIEKSWDIEVDRIVEAIGPLVILQAIRDHQDYTLLVADAPELHERLDGIHVEREIDGVTLSLADRIRKLISSLE